MSFGLRKLVADDREFTLAAHEPREGSSPQSEAGTLGTGEAVKQSRAIVHGAVAREFEASFEKRGGRCADDDTVGLADIAEPGKDVFCCALVVEVDLCAAIDPTHQQLTGVNRDFDGGNP